MKTKETLERLQQETVVNGLSKASKNALEEYSAALCHSQAYSMFSVNQFAQISETVRTNLLRSHIESLQSHVVELHNHITNLNDSNTKLQKLVVVLTVASLIGTGVQVWYAANSYKSPEEKSTTTASQLQAPTVKSEIPIQEEAQSSDQAKKKND